MLLAIIRLFSGHPVPGAAKIVFYRPDFYGNHAKAFTHEAMRGPSAWSVADRGADGGVRRQGRRVGVLVFWADDASPRTDPALVIRLTATEVLLGAGVPALSGERLQRYRECLRDADRLAALDAAVEPCWPRAPS